MRQVLGANNSGLPAEVWHRAVEEVDSDKDGKVTFSDFSKMFQKLIE